MSAEPTRDGSTHEPDDNHTPPETGSTPMTGPDKPAQAPTADPALAALAVLSRFDTADFDTVNALLDTTDDRELVMGLIEVSRNLASMVARAADTSPNAVFEHLRTVLLGLVNDGTMTAGPFRLP